MEKYKWFPTKEQLEKWKKENDGIHLLETEDGRGCIFKSPSRQVVKMAMSRVARAGEQVSGVEVLMKNCWLAGDESLKTDTGAHIGFVPLTDELMNVKKATLKKL